MSQEDKLPSAPELLREQECCRAQMRLRDGATVAKAYTLSQSQIRMYFCASVLFVVGIYCTYAKRMLRKYAKM